MKISVIIPVYNGEKYIAQCLENMIFQTYKELEIIVVNDGSTDNSAKIAEKYPVKVINQKNSGPAAARNTGIDNATGEYIHFMDVDDLVSLNFYERMLSVSTLTGADMVFCELIHERCPGLSYRFVDMLVISNVEDKLVLTNVRKHGYSVRYLFKLSFLRQNELRFDTEKRFMEDIFFSFKSVILSNKIATVPGAAYYYKHREQSLNTSKKKNDMKERSFCLKEAFNLCDEYARQNNIKILFAPPQKVQYKLFGIPLLKKMIFCTGKERWYLFGIYIIQRKSINK